MALRKLRPASDVDIDLTDAELTTRATDGDTTAFEELYKRHSESAWRVAYSVTGNRDDAADAVSEAFTRVFQALPAGRIGAGGAPFRPYLLVATRNAAIDHLRRTGRLTSSDDLEREAGPTIDLTPADRLVEGKDAAYVTSAFLALPERWRSVLWLTEVEGMQHRDVAPMLGVSPNGVAQLAVRARNGLKERFLQAHLEGPAPAACKPTIALLGAYTGGALSARDTAKVDQHLAGCAECRQRLAELEDVGSSLRRVIVPIPFGLAGLAAAKWKGALAMARTVPRGGSSTVSRALAVQRAQKPLMAVSVVTASLGIIGLGVVGGENGTDNRGSRPRTELGAPPQAIVDGFDLGLREADDPPAVRPEDELAAFGRLGSGAPIDPSFGGGVGGVPPEGGAGAPPGGTTSPPPNNPPPPAATPLLQATAAVRPAGATVAVGVGTGSCTGAALSAVALGSCPPPPGGGSVALQTGGTLLGDRSVTLG